MQEKLLVWLRHETFYSLEALNRGIRDALIKLDSREFQKRNGSRKILFETEEKPMPRALPLIPFEICEWSYNHKVGPNSHIWFGKGQYSVPIDYLNQYVDVRYNNAMVYIYSSHKLIAEHKRLPSGLKNGKRTEASHLPYPLYTPETVESTTAKAAETGANTTTVACRIYENAKIKEQALMDVRSVLDIAGIYGEKTLEEACRKALKDFHMITYNTLIPYIKDISKNKKNKTKSENGKEHLLTELITERQNRLIARLTKNAELKYPNASLETLDCEARGINKDTIANLASIGFVSTATNLIITGATGAGKTYLSCVLGVEACKQ